MACNVKINMETAKRVGENLRRKHAVPSQNLYRHIIGKATERGMKVNSKKTKLLCISDSLTFKAGAYVRDVGGEILETALPDSMKRLGFHFSDRLTVSKLIEVLRKRFRARLCILVHLRNAGLNELELVKVYKAILRPVHDYLFL